MFVLAGIFLIFLSYMSLKHIIYVKKNYELVEAEIVNIESSEVITENVGEIITIEYVFNNEVVRNKKEVKQGSVLGSKVYYYIKEDGSLLDKKNVTYLGPIILIIIAVICILMQFYGEPIY